MKEFPKKLIKSMHKNTGKDFHGVATESFIAVSEFSMSMPQ